MYLKGLKDPDSKSLFRYFVNKQEALGEGATIGVEATVCCVLEETTVEEALLRKVDVELNVGSDSGVLDDELMAPEELIALDEALEVGEIDVDADELSCVEEAVDDRVSGVDEARADDDATALEDDRLDGDDEAAEELVAMLLEGEELELVDE
ncbi:hypothetical protein CC86DRAFT_413633 [Ophiobolus disseminans]|uniref:Uncharacterized protein n=1 Tax=Ophiobolus disseminans TaxID=1469910 RepID=A0A6A6ZCN5_9PLEO|nr:hypothetical protein CC86DRAFT_413633 [Ophiobolus disseminans]